jgi:glutaconyl-CoA decarboxylase
MKKYLKKMETIGRPLSEKDKEKTRESVSNIKKVEEEILKAIEKVKTTGIPDEKIRKKGSMTIWDRIEYLVDPGSWCPLHTLYDPRLNEEGTTGVVDGLAKINGKWTVVIGFNNKVLAGAWISGQAENQLRVTDLAKRLHIPLVWLVNCSGVKMTEQEEVYADRRGNGATFFRHAELEQTGIPILAGIYGTNPAGGGYQAVSPTILLAHKDANMAVGGGGIVGGMKPRGRFDLESAEELIEATRQSREIPPGGVPVHFDKTGFFKEVYDTEQGVLDAIKKYIDMTPAYDLGFFRVAKPKEPKFPTEEITHIVDFNQRRAYRLSDVLGRIVDSSKQLEYGPDYGPEVYTGIATINGLLVGFIGNRQGFLMQNYPEYTSSYMGVGGKLYRQGLIKMNAFVTLCGRDRIPIVWLQDTSGIDVGDEAEEAELLGLGQTLIYSIEQTDVPQLCIVLRKGSAAAHYVMGGPTANNHNAFTLGTPTTTISVMYGPTAAAASFGRRLVKEKDAGRPLEPIIEKMNNLVKDYYKKSSPIYCAQRGFVDEVVCFPDLRKYIIAFTESAYQNPKSICPHNHMLLPRLVMQREFEVNVRLVPLMG